MVNKKAVVGLDLGNGQVKIKTDFEEIKMPSSILKRKYAGGDVSLMEGDTAVYQVADEPDAYVWSDDMKQFNRDNNLEQSRMESGRYTNPSFIRQVNFALARAVKPFPETSDGAFVIDNLVTGLPSNDFNGVAKTQLQKALIGEHNVTVDGVEKHIVVKNVTVIVQPLGTVLYYIIGSTFKMNKSEAQRTYAVIDLGAGTTLIDRISRMQHSAIDSISDYYGVVTGLIRQIRANARVGENPLTLTDYGVEFALRHQTETDRYIYEFSDTNRQDISEIVADGITEYSTHVANLLATQGQDLMSLDGIIITGGGANIINTDAIKNVLPANSEIELQVPKKSEFANVVGFYRLARYEAERA